MRPPARGALSNARCYEIDRRALNAMVLVKRHGNKLASYGVVAQAFREQAVHLKKAAAPIQQSVAPLVRLQLRILQRTRLEGMFHRAGEMMRANGRDTIAFSQSDEIWRRNIDAEEAEVLTILRHLVETVTVCRKVSLSRNT